MSLEIVIVPGPLLLLPEYAARTDPAPMLRTAAIAAIADALTQHPEAVPGLLASGTGRGERVARHLLAASGSGLTPHAVGERLPDQGVVLVVADGSARRGPKAPGHLDDRAAAFDASVGEALTSGDAVALADLDLGLAAALLADVEPLHRLGRLVDRRRIAAATVCFDDDPFGVQYWVVRWTCES